MRKRIFWSMALACLMAAGSSPAMGGSFGSAALVPHLSMEKTALTTADGVNVRFTLTNQGSDDLLVLQWKTPLAGIEGDLFAVERDGERVAYTGRMVKRAAPKASDYARIPAGESLSVTFDLSAVYDMRSDRAPAPAASRMHEGGALPCLLATLSVATSDSSRVRVQSPVALHRSRDAIGKYRRGAEQLASAGRALLFPLL
jgi:hypothetical protein